MDPKTGATQHRPLGGHSSDHALVLGSRQFDYNNSMLFVTPCYNAKEKR